MSTLVAVYRDRDTAEEVAHELESRDLHTTVSVADPADAGLSIAAEMDAQVEEGWGTAAVGGFVTSEQMRGAVVFASGLGLLGALVGLPVGWILFDASTSTLTKLGVGALVGFLFGVVVGALLGGGFAMTSPQERLAAERGVTVRVDGASPSHERIMEEHRPIRLDRIVRGQRVETPTTEGPHGVAETIAEFEANTADPRRRSGD
jgi:hypothetical protein